MCSPYFPGFRLFDLCGSCAIVGEMMINQSFSWIELGHAKLTECMENVLLIWAWVKIQDLANHRFLAYVYLFLVLTDGQLSKYWGSRLDP